ncbi:MAG TPA: hypothetical protein RMF84_10235 [Polyangiaceae bacterium LLY-WYZ-14_1]|nr:hypothetical protein [Polyangiaceae bacterium LLY-WYZ-14_1]
MSLRQESTVEVGSREVVVVSEILLEPEALVVTKVVSNGKVLKKQHAPVPAAAVADYETRGKEALSPCLHASHLRFVSQLLLASDPKRITDTGSPAPVGVVATMVLGRNGEVLAGAGEDHVPGAWLKASYLVSGLCHQASARLGLGGLRRAIVGGPGVAAMLVPSGERTGISFVDPNRIDRDRYAEVERHLRDVTCDTRLDS